MTDIETCERIVEQCDCSGVYCTECPLNNKDDYDCDKHISTYSAAKFYLKDHLYESDDTITDTTIGRKEAFSRMLNGEKLVPTRNYKAIRYCYYDDTLGKPFSVMYVDDTTKPMEKLMRELTWKVYIEEPVEVWQFAVKSKNKDASGAGLGEISKHMTEEQAYETFGKGIVKLEWTAKYEK